MDGRAGHGAEGARAAARKRPSRGLHHGADLPDPSRAEGLRPTRHWKISPSDFSERPHWDAYTEAFEAALTRCNSEWAPWYIIPANRKWFRNLAVGSAIVEKLESLNMKFPEPSFDVSTIRVD